MRLPLARLFVATASAVGLSLTLAAPAHAVSTPYPFHFGSDVVTDPTNGSLVLPQPKGDGARYIYVKENGSNGNWRSGTCTASGYDRDNGCLGDPFPSDDRNALSSINLAGLLARPGDVILVRGGTYDEAYGSRWAPATATYPIILQNYPGETVYAKGQFTLTNLNYWTIDGFKIWPGRSTKNTALVTFSGGSNWTLQNSQVAGSQGYANVIVQNNGSTPAKNFQIIGNCVNQAVGQKTAGTVHNLYIYPGNNSSGGVISHNILWGAKRGANIKAAGAAASYKSSPGQLLIERNTMLYSSTGVVTGLEARNVTVQNNFITYKMKDSAVRYEAALKSYQSVAASYARSNRFQYNLVSAFTPVLSYESARPVTVTGNKSAAFSATPVTGSAANCSIRLDDKKTTLGKYYGHTYYDAPAKP